MQKFHKPELTGTGCCPLSSNTNHGILGICGHWHNKADQGLISARGQFPPEKQSPVPREEARLKTSCFIDWQVWVSEIKYFSIRRSTFTQLLCWVKYFTLFLLIYELFSRMRLLKQNINQPIDYFKIIMSQHSSIVQTSSYYHF